MRIFQLKICEADRILVISPHPDDESIGAGGLILRFASQCDVVVMTDGRYGNSNIRPDEMASIRKKEIYNAMKFADVNEVLYYGIEDGTLISHTDCFSQIDFSEYSAVFLPNPNDSHSDHTASYEYAIETIKKQQLHNTKVFKYEVHQPLSDVTCYIDISEVIGKKQQLLGCHKSQIEIHPYVEQAKILAEYRAYQNEQPGKYLETFSEVNLGNIVKSSTGTELELSKYKKFTYMLSQWIEIRNSSLSIAQYLIEKGHYSIAIYGYGQIGKILYKELCNTGLRINYIIDKNTNIEECDISVYHTLDVLEKVDVVIVTTLFCYEEIMKEISEKSGLVSISLESILHELGRRLR